MATPATEMGVRWKERLPRGFAADNGMNIVGQGARILLFTAPALVGAVLAHRYRPDLVRLPLAGRFLTSLGVAMAIAGVTLWATALTQLLLDFPKGRLVTTGAYGLCRNPIYLFGEEYRQYTERVHRILPFVRPKRDVAAE